VRQESFESLERTLLALHEEYMKARDAADRQRQRQCRQLVIEAKDHARWALRRAKDDQQKRQRQEMIQWMLVWLENPEIFPQWLRLRKRQLARLAERLPTGDAEETKR